jgi:hypothetical protein
VLFTPGKGKEFFLEQLGFLGTGDIDRILDEHYHPDAVMVTFDGVRRGRDQLKEYYVNTLRAMGQVKGMSVQYFLETEDVIMFKATVEDERGTIHADNGFYMRDGKIYRHVSLTLLPNFDYEKQGVVWKG